jgi:HEAT repeat protein
MGHVFISYQNGDGDFVAELVRQLDGAGFPVWSDSEGLRGGDGWGEAIDQAIREAFAVIVVLTPAARMSEQIMYEWMFALGVGVRVIVILREPTELHPRLEPLPRVDFSDGSAYPWGKLVRLVQEARDNDRRLLSRLRPGERPAFFGAPRPSFLDRARRRDPAGEEDFTAGGPDSVSRLIDALDGENAEARISAAQRLGGIGDKSAIPSLIRLLRDDDWNVREAAAQALGRMKAAGAVVGLLEALRVGRPGPFGASGGPVFMEAIRAIGALAVPVLVDALSDDDPRMRLYIVDLLHQIGEPDAVLALTGALRDPEWRVRWRAADALGRLGSDAAVPDLVEMLSDSSKDVRISAAWALGKIGHGAAVPGLIRLLHDRDWRVRWGAAEALWEIGEAAVPALIATLSEPDEYVRRAAIRALAEIGEAAIPALITALGDANWDVRWSAAAALQEIGDAAVPALVQALNADDWQAAWAAAETLKRIGTPEALDAVEGWREGRESEGEQPLIVSGPDDTEES